VKYKALFLYILRGLAYRGDPSADFNAESRKDVPFWGSNDGRPQMCLRKLKPFWIIIKILISPKL